jgi:hypothetical protein
VQKNWFSANKDLFSMETMKKVLSICTLRIQCRKSGSTQTKFLFSLNLMESVLSFCREKKDFIFLFFWKVGCLFVPIETSVSWPTSVWALETCTKKDGPLREHFQKVSGRE